MLLWCPPQLGATTRNLILDDDNDATFGDWLRVGSILVPWHGSADPWDTFPALQREAVIMEPLLLSISPEVTNITPAQPGPLGASYAVAKFTPITFDLNNIEHTPAIYCKIDGQTYWQLVYDGTSETFSPRFSTDSTATDNGANPDGSHDWSFSLLPLGGWTGDVAVGTGNFNLATIV
jgi:hypothetical protein